MKHLIAVKPDGDGQYIASAVGIPELQARAPTVQKAVDRVQEQLSEWLRTGQLIQVDVPDQNPLLKWIVHAEDDPDFDLYLEEIKRFRNKMDEQECPNSSSIPIT